jgi:peptide/nickel transport system substrate-binding protein
VVRVLELERGGVGFLQEQLEPEILDRLRRLAAARHEHHPRHERRVSWPFNFRDRRLADRRVRRAIAAAIDPDLLVRALLGPTARPATGPADARALGLCRPCRGRAVATARAAPPRPRRLRRSRRPGARRALPIVYKTSNQPGRRRLAEALQAELAAVGIALDVRTYEWGTLFADIRSGNFELASMTWVGVADPDLYRLAYHSGMEPPAGLNRGRYASRTMDRLTDAGHRTLEPERRRAIYGQVQRWAARDLPATAALVGGPRRRRHEAPPRLRPSAERRPRRPRGGAVE